MQSDNKKAKACFLAASVFIILLSFSLPVAAVSYDTVSHSWYIMRKSDHSQPEIEPQMSFIRNYDAFYIDPVHSKAEDGDKVLYLTFDAGYENGNIEKILDTLKEKDVKGAFFILENMIERFPLLVMRMKDEGHLVCNHTATHKDMSKVMDIESFKTELTALSEKYKALTGENMPKFYRPPEGRFSECNLKFAKSLGYKTVFWSFAYADWDNNAQPSKEQALKTVLDNTHNGGILLLHPTSATNAAILGELIDTWRADGYRFGTLSELSCEK